MLPVSPGDSLRSAGGSDPVSFQMTASVQGPGMHKTFCTPFESGVSIFYSPLALLKVNPAGLQSQTSGGLSAQCRSPRTPHSLGRTSCNCNYPPIGELPTWDVELDQFPTLPPHILLWFLFYIFSCRRSFLLAFRSFSSIAAL